VGFAWLFVQACAASAESGSDPQVSDGTTSGSTTGGDLESADDTDETDFPIYSTGNADAGGQSSEGLAGSSSVGNGACLRVLSLGKPADLGAVPGQGGFDAVVEWLNLTSNAAADHLPGPTALTPELLDSYDVILIQDLSAWELTPDDVFHFSQWVKAGGGAIALSGYSGSGLDVVQSNALLSFTGLNFSVTAQDSALVLGECGYCLGASRKTAGFDVSHPISAEVQAVGSFLGRSVQGEGQLVLSEDGLQLGVTKELEQGRVFLFHDDWISYVSQWTGEVTYACENNPSCAEESPEYSYQVAQFWFNALGWAGRSSCLVINDDSVIR
jgi:hypothetical protein